MKRRKRVKQQRDVKQASARGVLPSWPHPTRLQPGSKGNAMAGRFYPPRLPPVDLHRRRDPTDIHEPHPYHPTHRRKSAPQNEMSIRNHQCTHPLREDEMLDTCPPSTSKEVQACRAMAGAICQEDTVLAVMSLEGMCQEVTCREHQQEGRGVQAPQSY